MSYTPAYMLPDTFRDGWVISLVEQSADYRKYAISNQSIKIGQMGLIVRNGEDWLKDMVMVRYYSNHETHNAWIKRTDLRRPTNEEVMAVPYGEYVAIHGRIG